MLHCPAQGNACCSVWAWIVTFIFFGREADRRGAPNQSSRRDKAFKRFVFCGVLWHFSVGFYNSWIMKVSVHFQGHSTLTINLCLRAHNPVTVPDNNIKQLEFCLKKDMFIGRFLFKWVYMCGVFLMLGIGFVSY